MPWSSAVRVVLMAEFPHKPLSKTLRRMPNNPTGDKIAPFMQQARYTSVQAPPVCADATAARMTRREWSPSSALG